MTHKKAEYWTIVPAHDDVIRIVETYVQQEARPAAPAAANLTYRGGPLLAQVEVFSIFWGAAWEQSPQSDLAVRLNTFFDFILSSPLMDQLGEYSVPQYTISHGKYTGTTTVSTPPLGPTVSDRAIQHMIEQEIATNASVPQPNANTLYFVFTPPGVSVIQGGGRSCSVFCGYHNDVNGQIFYAVMPFPDCSGCLGPLNQFDALTSITSHELCEAITDPIPGQGWYDDANGEIGDICAWQTRTLGQYTVQLEWSNQQKACI